MFGFIDTVSLDELKSEMVLLSTRSIRNRNLSLQPLGVDGPETPHAVTVAIGMSVLSFTYLLTEVISDIASLHHEDVMSEDPTLLRQRVRRKAGIGLTVP